MSHTPSMLPAQTILSRAVTVRVMTLFGSSRNKVPLTPSGNPGALKVGAGLVPV